MSLCFQQWKVVVKVFFRISTSLSCSMLHWYVDDLFFFFRRRGRTWRASLLWRSRVTLTLVLRGRRRRRRTAARTPAICATRSSRRAALCWDTNMNTQVNTHATSHKALPGLRLNKHATRNHSLFGGNMSQSLSNRAENGGFFCETAQSRVDTSIPTGITQHVQRRTESPFPPTPHLCQLLVWTSECCERRALLVIFNAHSTGGAPEWHQW